MLGPSLADSGVRSERAASSESPSPTSRRKRSAQRKRLEKKRWFRCAQKWRTGCEGRISLLKRRSVANIDNVIFAPEISAIVAHIWLLQTRNPAEFLWRTVSGGSRLPHRRWVRQATTTSYVLDPKGCSEFAACPQLPTPGRKRNRRPAECRFRSRGYSRP